VNSSHHQSADKIGEVAVNALSEDGVVEGWSGRMFRINQPPLVQWHPERMRNQESSFAKNVDPIL
jgi:putative glutamine amidotransferase